MGKVRTFCPHCGKVVPAGQACGCRPRPKRRPTPGDATRAEREPWRREYNTPEYRDARQQAIERTQGRCTDCGAVCASLKDGRWVTGPLGGEVDHVKALSEGGSNDPRNLELRCKSCHARRDAARRRRG